MAVKAYVLVNTVPNKSKEVFKKLQDISGVKHFSPVTGPFDAVLVVEATDNNQLQDIVLNRVRPIEGLLTTQTLIALGGTNEGTKGDSCCHS